MVDIRGFGLSDSDIGLFTVEAFGQDIDAVAAKLEARKFDLVAGGMATKVALAYAATNLERVGLLALFNPPAMAPGPSVTYTRVDRLFGNMLLADWDMFSETLAGVQFGWDDARRERAAQLIRASTTAEGLRHFAAFTASLDLRPHLAGIRCPVLSFSCRARRVAPKIRRRPFARTPVNWPPPSRMRRSAPFPTTRSRRTTLSRRLARLRLPQAAAR
jgi:pimeloyl-ACP methyl ester carboxylesterase